jgi:hypothetical protein
VAPASTSSPPALIGDAVIGTVYVSLSNDHDSNTDDTANNANIDHSNSVL